MSHDGIHTEYHYGGEIICIKSLFSHGSLAESLVRTSRLILGNQPDIRLTAAWSQGAIWRDEKQVGAIHPALNDSGQEVLVLTDLMYGTPFNTMIQLEENVPLHITGTNLPLLIEAINRRHWTETAEVLQDWWTRPRKVVNSHVAADG